MNSHLIRLSADIAMRDLEAKYKRSSIGLLWLIVTPLAMLGIYWMVFGVVLNISWQHPLTQERAGFIFPFFIGLVFYLFVTDIVMSSANLFLSKRTYVIKASFPIGVLWLANMMRAGAHTTVNLAILFLLALSHRHISMTGFFWMLAGLTSGLLFVCALSLLLSCLGPFIGDISESAQLILRVLFYTAPVTYPIEIVPEQYRVFLWLNPLTHLIEPVRRAMVFGRAPDLTLMLLFIFFSGLMLGLSIWIFQRTRGVIADVV
jgi:lipopolysaccharide transport system permease protein